MSDLKSGCENVTSNVSLCDSIGKSGELASPTRFAYALNLYVNFTSNITTPLNNFKRYVNLKRCNQIQLNAIARKRREALVAKTLRLMTVVFKKILGRDYENCEEDYLQG